MQAISPLQEAGHWSVQALAQVLCSKGWLYPVLRASSQDVATVTHQGVSTLSGRGDPSDVQPQSQWMSPQCPETDPSW